MTEKVSFLKKNGKVQRTLRIQKFYMQLQYSERKKQEEVRKTGRNEAKLRNTEKKTAKIE